MEFNSLLVPVDLTPISERLFQQAALLVTGENPVIILLHVIDPALVHFGSTHDFGSNDEIVQRMRHRAQQELERFRDQVAGRIEVDIIVSEGPPFLQIVQKAQEFLADAIVMGKVTGARVEKLLFGSTAEKVMRASSRPVVVLPIDVG